MKVYTIWPLDYVKAVTYGLKDTGLEPLKFHLVLMHVMNAHWIVSVVVLSLSYVQNVKRTRVKRTS